MASGRKILFLYALTLLGLSVCGQKQYDMDKLSTCGRDVIVGDDGVRLNARGAVSPSNPPLQCIVYLRSVYTRSDGTNKMQIEVESFTIRDGAITVDIFEGRNSVGRYIKRLSYREGSTAIIYSQTNEITVRLNRPNVLYRPEYRFTLLIKPWKDRDVIPPSDGKEVLSIGAIIGIVFGCLILVAVIILFCWCCCTGRVLGTKEKPSNDSSGFVTSSGHRDMPGAENKALAGEKGRPNFINFNDPVVWNTVTTGNYSNNQRPGPRYDQRNAPPYDRSNAGQNGDYEPYNYDKQQGQGQRFRQIGRGYDRRNEPSQAMDIRTSLANSKAKKENQVQNQPAKETLIDEVFESDSENRSGDWASTDVDDATLQKRPLGSPKQRRKEEKALPEEKNLHDSPHLERYKSMDLQSQPDTETILSPLHVNAGVRARVEDDDISPTSSLRKQKKGGKSPKMKRAGEREPDPLAMPPEAFEPIFSGQISGVNYPSHRDGALHPNPGGFMPYGLIPAMHFAPAAPGAQTYSYAYQTAPGGGPPATQGAYIVQNVPTSDGNRRTAFAVEQTTSPDEYNSKDRRRKNSDPFRRNDNRSSGGSKHSKAKGRDHDLAVISRGAAPPDPGPGHRSVAMKSGTDPDTGIQTTQAIWTDTVPDATDPKPGENPQITRKTITRVTAKSGFGELPPEPNPLLDLNDEEPAFLSPTPKRTMYDAPPSHPNAAIKYTPDRGNIAFYTGAGSAELPPERSSTPIHHSTAYSKAIRDRIPMDDSTV